MGLQIDVAGNHQPSVLNYKETYKSYNTDHTLAGDDSRCLVLALWHKGHE